MTDPLLIPADNTNSAPLSPHEQQLMQRHGERNTRLGRLWLRMVATMDEAVRAERERSRRWEKVAKSIASTVVAELTAIEAYEAEQKGHQQ